MAAKKPDAAAFGARPLKDVAALIGVSTRRVMQLVEEGMIPSPGTSGYDVAASVQGYIRSLKVGQASVTKKASANRLQDAKTRLVELRVAEAERRLCTVADADAAIDAVVAIVRAELAGLPARATRDIALRDRLESELHGALQRIAARAAAESLSAEPGGADAEAVAEAQP